MDIQIFSSPVAFLIILLLFLFKLVKELKQSNKQKLPPGPPKLPFIGSLLSMVSSEVPHHALRKLAKKYGPLMHLQLGEISAIVISSAQVAKEVMVTHDLAFADRPQVLASEIIMYNSTNIGFAPYGNYWRQMRKICTVELLSAKKVRTFSPIREEEVNHVIEYILSSSGSPINLTEKIFKLTNSITCRAAFGNSCKDQDLLIQLLKEMADLAGGFDVADLFPSYKLLHSLTGKSSKLEKVHQGLDKIFSDIIDKHIEKVTSTNNKAYAEEDILGVLFRLKESGDLEFPITLDNIKAIILDIFAGGTDTASASVEWAMTELVRNPKVMMKAQTEVREALKGKKRIDDVDIKKLKYLNLVIKETMRLHTIVPLLLPRECREQCIIDGYEIPIKTKVIVNAWALARDPASWHDADSFDPERSEISSLDSSGTNLAYIPFGAGRRMCPGILLGMANVEQILANLLYHFDWKLPSGMKPEDLDMNESFRAAARKRNNLYLVATPYSPL